MGVIETLLVLPPDSLHQAGRLQCIGEEFLASGEEVVRAPAAEESSRERGDKGVGAKDGDAFQREATATQQVRLPVAPHMSKLIPINLDGSVCVSPQSWSPAQRRPGEDRKSVV